MKLKLLFELMSPRVAVFRNKYSGEVSHNKIVYAGLTMDDEPVQLMADIDGNFIDPRAQPDFVAIVSQEAAMPPKMVATNEQQAAANKAAP